MSEYKERERKADRRFGCRRRRGRGRRGDVEVPTGGRSAELGHGSRDRYG